MLRQNGANSSKPLDCIRNNYGPGSKRRFWPPKPQKFPAAERSSSSALVDDRGVVIAEQVVRIDVQKDRLIVRFKSAGSEEESHSTDGEMLPNPWKKTP